MEVLVTIFGLSGYIIFLIVSFISVKYTMSVTRSILNVTSCLSVPLAIICTLQVYLTYFAGFYSKPDIVYWILLSLYVILTAIVESYISKITNAKKYTLIKGHETSYRMGTYMNIVIALFIIYACYDSYKVVSSMDLALILQDEGQDNFGASAGGGFYVRVFLMIMATYYLGYGKDWKEVVIGLLCFFPSLVVNTKGIIFIPIIAAYIVRYLNGKIKNVRKSFISIGLVGACIFFASYMWEFFTVGENSILDPYKWQYIGEKLLYYLTAGVQGFSSNISASDSAMYFDKVDNITIAPFSNFLSKFGLMGYIQPVSERIQHIGEMPLYGSCDSNVNTYIGTIYLYNSFLGGILLHIFWVTITTLIKIHAIKYRKPFTVCLFALFATGYVLGWFEFYFMQTFWVYMIAMVVILNVINLLSKNNKNAEI